MNTRASRRDKVQAEIAELQKKILQPYVEPAFGEIDIVDSTREIDWTTAPRRSTYFAFIVTDSKNRLALAWFKVGANGSDVTLTGKHDAAPHAASGYLSQWQL